MKSPHSQMTASSAILALVLYPLVFILPLNLVRFRWGFTHGLKPMPSEVQEGAEAADRLVYVVNYAVLLALVFFLLHGSSISGYEVGLTIDNWKPAMALGVLLSAVPLGLGAIMQRILTSDELREEQESRGHLAIWFGLTALGSVSTEFWRVFCIATLTRVEFPAWIALLVVAVAYGVPWLTTNTARAAGAAFYGGVAGFLFVKTGSLLAPLAMSLITGGAHLYRVRHIPSRTESNLVPLKSPMSSQTMESTQNLRLYVTCPVCSASFHAGKVKATIRTFNCPECGEVLEYETRGLAKWLPALNFLGVPILLYLLGIRGSTLVFASIGGAILMQFLGIAIYYHFSPLKAKQREDYRGLRLTDEPRRREDHPPTDDEGPQ